MKKLIYIIFACALFAVSTEAQTVPSASPTPNATAESKTKSKKFRANKEQIMETQMKLKTGGMYAGEQTGKLDDATRDGIKKFQEANGVKVTGTLNKETL
ncbi:MAG: peptidoglycan-binding protein [Acidobacteriota bacterium]|nr:peptidoglycan-binding protein [Acidobacteriota bacterium]